MGKATTQSVINDPAAVAFTQDQARPLSERLSALTYELEWVLARYNEVAEAFTSNPNGEIEENRPANDGHLTLTGNDMMVFINVANDVFSTLYNPANKAAIEKLNVRGPSFTPGTAQ